MSSPASDVAVLVLLLWTGVFTTAMPLTAVSQHFYLSLSHSEGKPLCSFICCVDPECIL